MGLGGLFLLLVVIGLLFDGSSTEPMRVNDSESSVADIDQQTTGNSAEFSVGEVVRLGDREFTVNSSRRTKTIGYSTAKSEQEYVVVNVTIQNRGSDEVTFNTFDFKMQDASGVQKSADASTYSLDDSLESGTLAPNGTLTGSMVFEVPAGDSVKLIFQPGFWTNERVVVAL